MKRVSTPAKNAKRTKGPGKATTSMVRAADRSKTGSSFQSVRYTPSLGPLGFPKKLRATLRYAATQGVTLTSSDVGNYIFSANGLYDPNITSTGHQPMYFDTLMGIYNHYTVLSSKITVQAVTQPNADGATMYLGLDDDTTLGNYLAFKERSSFSSKVMSEGAPAVTLNNYFSAYKTFGGSILGNDQLQGNATNNPAEQQYYIVSVQTPIALTSKVFYFNVTIDYNVVFDELKSEDLS